MYSPNDRQPKRHHRHPVRKTVAGQRAIVLPGTVSVCFPGWLSRGGHYCLGLAAICPIRFVMCVDDSAVNELMEQRDGFRVVARRVTGACRSRSRTVLAPAGVVRSESLRRKAGLGDHYLDLGDSDPIFVVYGDFDLAALRKGRTHAANENAEESDPTCRTGGLSAPV